MTRATARLSEQWRNSIVRYADERPDSLLAHPLNPKNHPKSQTDALSGAISEVGWIAPVIVNETTGHVIDGHARIGLAISRGEPSVPVAYVQLTEQAERLALATFDPIGNLAVMDSGHLTALLEGLTSADEAVANLLRDLAPPKPKNLNPDDADLTPPAEPITKLGDLWVMGEHRLLCGDATKAEDVEWLLAGAKPALMVTDPPYGVDYDANWRNEAADKGLIAHAAIRVGLVVNDNRVDWREAWRLAPAKVAYCWHGYMHSSVVRSSLESAGFEIRGDVVWAKQRFVISRGHYHSQYEAAWYAVRKGAIAEWIGDHSQSDLWEISLDRNVEGGHSTQKPVECMARPIRNHRGDVYDPFLGSGTTLIAAEQLGRRCYAMEIEPAYVDVAARRWERVTGGQAVKAHA